MFAEKYYDFADRLSLEVTCCGEVIDPTIVANRARNNSLILG